MEEMNEPSEEIPKEIKQTFNKSISGINENNNNVHKNNPGSMNNKFGYSNNQRNLNNMQLRNAKTQSERTNKGKIEKECSIF